MPLTQDRMIEVLGEAEVCREQFATFREGIRLALRDINEPVALIATIRMLTHDATIPAMTRCAIEREHFAKRARANEANARRTARARARRRGETHDDTNHVYPVNAYKR